MKTCQFFRNANIQNLHYPGLWTPENQPSQQKWRMPGSIIEQTINVFCDGNMHTWLDSAGASWGCRCPNAGKTEKQNRVSRWIGKPVYFEDFDIDYNGLGKQLKEIQSWYHSGLKKLLILGPRDTGKTLACKMLFTYLVEIKSENCVFYTNIQLQELFRSIYPDTDTITQRRELWQSGFIFIDDLGYGEEKYFEEKLKEILDNFYGRIVINSNRSWPNSSQKENLFRTMTGEVFKYDDRILSRLKRGTKIIFFHGEPYPEKIKEKK